MSELCPWCDAIARCGHPIHDSDEVQRLKAELAAKDAEIASLTADVERLRAQVETDAHLRSVVELYRSDPMAMAESLWRMRDEVGALRTRLEQLEQRPA